ncbi:MULTISPECIES: hotdog fold thioesterase [Citricoccus]|jgi:1,4-dihydroxy-2-naphthoyl-CoA hydrolase|uniref:hotdog fold thioesterase n=1 Tax=Citricoccus TaxID=169133 RepID=UPI000255EBBE
MLMDSAQTRAPAAAPYAFVPGVTPDPSPEELRRLMLDSGIPEEIHGRLGRLGISPLTAKMGIVFQEMTVERMVATMPVAGNEQNAGLLHGGAHLVLAETLGSIAAVLHAGKPVVGIEIGATHHRGIQRGTVTGTCTPIHLGGTLTTHEIVMTDEQGRRLSTARITNMILDPERRKG